MLEIYIEGGKLDLHKEDNILLKSSISEVQDVSKIFTDSTNSFSIPATDNNNNILKHFYDNRVSDSINIFRKLDGALYLGGVFYRQGKFRLDNVSMKRGKPSNYKLSYFGVLNSLKDILSEDKLNALDLSHLDFELTPESAKEKLITGSKSNVIATTLSNKRLIYSSQEDIENTENTLYIAGGDVQGNRVNGLIWSELNYSVKNIEVLEAIESKYGLNFSRDFFGSNIFTESYLLLNRDNDSFYEEQIVFDGDNNDPTLYDNRVLLSDNLPIGNKTLTLEVDFFSFSTINANKPLTFIVKSGDDVIVSENITTNAGGDFQFNLNPDDYESFTNLTFFIKTSTLFNYRVNIKRVSGVGTGAIVYNINKNQSQIKAFLNVSNSLPDLKVIDWLNGFIKAAKLVLIGDDNGGLYVDSIESFYRIGSVKNITKHLDYSSYDISVGKLYSEINYIFSEPTTILAKQFKELNGVAYGDLNYNVLYENGDVSEGEKIEVKLPFENVVYERLYDLTGSVYIQFMYGYLANDSLSPVTPKAHIHYVYNLNTGGFIKFIQNDDFSRLSNVNVPTHTLELDIPSESFLFGSEFNEWNGNKINSTLFSNYHDEYISEIFSNNKRLFKIKCKNLPVNFILDLKLNDVIQIEEQYYRINRYNVNLITRECDFELLTINNLNLTPKVRYTTDSIENTTDSTIITTDSI